MKLGIISLLFNFYLPANSLSLDDKWYDREERDPRVTLKSFEKLIRNGKTSEANELVNKVLEDWSRKDSKIMVDEAQDLLTLATRIHSGYYYSIIRGKVLKIKRDFEGLAYSKYFKLLPMHSEESYVSLTDFLVGKTNIDPIFLEKFDISLETLRKILETKNYEILRYSNERIFPILHAIALYAKTDPYFSLNLFPDEGTTLGRYHFQIRRVDLMVKLENDKQFKRTLVHEWMHQLIAVLLDCSLLPYKLDDIDQIIDFESIKQKIEASLDKIKADYEIDSEANLNSGNSAFDFGASNLLRVRYSYVFYKHDEEYIVRFSEILVGDVYEDPQVRKLYEPLRSFWDAHIAPAINAYINEHVGIDAFSSDQKRETILHPLYSEIKLDEYKIDLYEIENKLPMAEAIADKWYDRGKRDPAIEFDKKAVEAFLDKAEAIADKWYDRGEWAVAIEFDKKAVEAFLDEAEAIADKWYDRGKRDPAIEFDKKAVEAFPYNTGAIAYKWYNREERDLAIEFDDYYSYEDDFFEDEL